MGFWKLFNSVKPVRRTVCYYKIAFRTCCVKRETNKSVDNKSSFDSKKGVVIGVYEGESDFILSDAAEEANKTTDGKMSQRLSDYSSRLKLGKACIATDILPDTTVALASLGPKDSGFNKLEELDEARENVRTGIGAGVMKLKAEGCTEIEVDPTGSPDAAAEAAYLASWRFQEFKASGVRLPEIKISAMGGGGGSLWEHGTLFGCSQNWARFLADMPANKMAPVDLAQAALDMLCPLGVSVEARDYDWIKANNMQAFLAVARGSCEPPVFLECVYTGAGRDTPPVLVAAKGVTFDSGGLCLKAASSMTENRGSMAGAAAALAALRAAALSKLKMNIVCVIPICENMVSGQCMKVGDVVPALNGLNIQIEHTDLEGRLMLADALVYAQHKHQPKLVIDVATFTHGALLATGGGAFACFSNSAGAWRAAQRAGAATGDRPWRLPLWRYYRDRVSNEPSVDLRNMGSGRATPCLGAAFLRNFICGPWIHMDITGVGKLAEDRAPSYLSPRRMTGRPTRTLAAMFELLAKSETNIAETTDRIIESCPQTAVKKHCG